MIPDSKIEDLHFTYNKTKDLIDKDNIMASLYIIFTF